MLKKENKVLLGKRVYKPTQGYFFSIAGRVNKNWTIDNAIARIVKNKLNIEIKFTPEFISVLEHFLMVVFMKMYQHAM